MDIGESSETQFPVILKRKLPRLTRSVQSSFPMRTTVPILLLLLFSSVLATAKDASACGCCSSFNDFSVQQMEIRDLLWDNFTFTGEAGVYIYGEKGGPDFPVGEGQITGTVEESAVTLTVWLSGKSVGKIRLLPIGKVEYSRVGMDFILPESELNQYRERMEPPIYHQQKIKVAITADDVLQKKWKVAFHREALLTLHGLSNSCWPAESARWSLNYTVLKGKESESAFARGTLGTKPLPE